MSLKKSDFYFGALISRLMKTGSVPAIIEEGDGRSIYSISNDHGEFEVYTKYCSKPILIKRGKRWNFTFSVDEVSEVKCIRQKEGVSYLFCLICGEKGLVGSKIAFLTYDQLRTIIGEEDALQMRNVSIVLENGNWNYQVYGTGLGGIKQAMKVTRNVNKRLIEIGFMK